MRHFELASKITKTLIVLALAASAMGPVLADEGVIEQQAPVEVQETNFDDLSPIVLNNGFRYDFQEPTVEQSAAFVTMSSGEMLLFFKKRRKMLLSLAKLLNGSQLFYGPGILIGNKIKQITGDNTVRTAAEAAEISQYQYVKRQMIQKALREIEFKLFEKAKVFAGANEQGFALAFGAGGGILIGRVGRIVNGTLGFSFGYNFATEKLVFEVYSQIVQGRTGAAAVVGVSGGVTWYSARTEENGDILRAMNGDVMSLPGPYSMSFFEERITRTLSQGIAVGMSTYVGTNNRRVLFRGLISNPFAGFVRFFAERGLNMYHFVTAPVETTAQALMTRIRDVKRGQCSGEFKDL